MFKKRFINNKSDFEEGVLTHLLRMSHEWLPHLNIQQLPRFTFLKTKMCHIKNQPMYFKIIHILQNFIRNWFLVVFKLSFNCVFDFDEGEFTRLPTSVL